MVYGIVSCAVNVSLATVETMCCILCICSDQANGVPFSNPVEWTQDKWIKRSNSAEHYLVRYYLSCRVSLCIYYALCEY